MYQPTHQGTRNCHGGETWVHWAVFDPKATQEDFNEWAHSVGCSGPGLIFHHSPFVYLRTATRVLILQHGGLDI